MDDLFLCVADSNGRVACFLKAGDEGLEFVSGTPESGPKIGAVLTDLLSRGVHARSETFRQGRIDVDFVKVGPDDPRFLESAAAEFRTRSWLAAVYPRRIAGLWRKLYVLPVSLELRASFSERLRYVPADALAELEAGLDAAAADFDRLAAQTPT